MDDLINDQITDLKQIDRKEKNNLAKNKADIIPIKSAKSPTRSEYPIFLIFILP